MRLLRWAAWTPYPASTNQSGSLRRGATGTPAVGRVRLLDRGAGLLEAYGAGQGPTYGLDLAAITAWVRSQIERGPGG